MIIRLINALFNGYMTLLVLYALMSWFPELYESSIGKTIVKLVHPYISFFDRHIPSIGGLSFNVIIAAFVLQFIQRGLYSILSLFL